MIDFNIINLTECDSTNAYLQNKISGNDTAEGLVISTLFQTKGRGQLSNVWESERSKNLLCSILLRPETLPVKQQFLISQAISVAIVEVLNTYSDGFKIKWPNDIYYKEFKIAGILIENNLSSGGIGSCIIGIGLNVNQTEFHSDAPNPISLKNILGHSVNILKLLDEILSAFNLVYTLVYSDVKMLRERYFDLLLFNGEERIYSDASGNFIGKIIDVEGDGHLLVLDSTNNIRRYAFKEISIIPNY